ncbi:MAG: N-acetylmuramoyl-L-alanine amidase-like domain-containing protein [Cyanobacteriota bacterium]|jgi:hypothetical protein
MPRFRPIAAGLAVSLVLQAGCRSENSLATQSAPAAPAAAPAVPAAPAAPAAAPATLPPLLVGNTAEVAADAVDATAQGPRGRSLVGLARRFLGRPYQAFSLDQGPGEQLRLDLTQFDCFLFVEQLLALVNSHRVSTRTAAVEDFSRHVQKLRYQDGQVDYCHRHHYFSRWAAAAERQGYLVNLTPFLPGAVSRSRRLNFMSTHTASYAPLKQPRNLACIQALEKDLSVQQSYVPLAALPQVLPSLRGGDIFGLVTKVEGLDVTHVGVVDGTDAIHAAPGRGVMRSPDLVRYAAGVPDVIGVMVLRPIPNPDGKPSAPLSSAP